MRKYFHYSSKRFPAGSESGTALQEVLEEPQIRSRSAVGCSERRRYCSVRRRDVEMIFTGGGQWSSRSPLPILHHCSWYLNLGPHVLFLLLCFQYLRHIAGLKSIPERQSQQCTLTVLAPCTYPTTVARLPFSLHPMPPEKSLYSVSVLPHSHSRLVIILSLFFSFPLYKSAFCYCNKYLRSINFKGSVVV